MRHDEVIAGGPSAIRGITLARISVNRPQLPFLNAPHVDGDSWAKSVNKIRGLREQFTGSGRNVRLLLTGLRTVKQTVGPDKLLSSDNLSVAITQLASRSESNRVIKELSLLTT